MDIESKKAQVYRLVKLGMDVYESQLLAGCTVEEIDAMSADDAFSARCSFLVMVKEKELLEKIDEIIEYNAGRGVSKEITWKLEKMNPKKYGKTVSVSLDKPLEEKEQVDLSRLSESERDSLLEAVSKTITRKAE